MVCFDSVDVIVWFGSKSGIVLVYGCYCLKTFFKRRQKKIIVIVRKSALERVTRSVNLRISNSLKGGSECSFGFKKVIIHTALF